MGVFALLLAITTAITGGPLLSGEQGMLYHNARFRRGNNAGHRVFHRGLRAAHEGPAKKNRRTPPYIC
jgi:hypothetical protein